MKKVIAVLILIAAVGAAYAADNGKATKKNKTAAAPKTATAQVLTIPKDAVQRPDGTYGYTDKKGKKWIYTNTPFGVSRFEDTGATTPAAGPDLATKAIDKGEVVRFERPSPFGTMSWEKKKSELNDGERQVFDAQYPKAEEAPAAAPDNGTPAGVEPK